MTQFVLKTLTVLIGSIFFTQNTIGKLIQTSEIFRFESNNTKVLKSTLVFYHGYLYETNPQKSDSLNYVYNESNNIKNDLIKEEVHKADSNKSKWYGSTKSENLVINLNENEEFYDKTNVYTKSYGITVPQNITAEVYFKPKTIKEDRFIKEELTLRNNHESIETFKRRAGHGGVCKKVSCYWVLCYNKTILKDGNPQVAETEHSRSGLSDDQGFDIWECEDVDETDGILFNLRENDYSLALKTFSKHEFYEISKYCEDSASERIYAFFCYENVPQRKPTWNLVYAILQLISCGCILLTLALHAKNPKLIAILHIKMFCVYLACLFISYCMVAILRLVIHFSDPFDENSYMFTPETCFAYSIINHFCLLSSIFWLNAICFKLCLRKMILPTLLVYKDKRLVQYSLYAFGVPFLLTSTLAMMHIFSDKLPTFIIKPDINYKGHCTLAGTSFLLYLMVPLVAVSICNLVLYAVSELKIRKALRQNSYEIAYLQADSQHIEQRKKNMKIVMRRLSYRIFIVTGINWVFEAISSLLTRDKYGTLIMILDAYNLILGVIILILSVYFNRILINKARDKSVSLIIMLYN